MSIYWAECHPISCMLHCKVLWNTMSSMLHCEVLWNTFICEDHSNVYDITMPLVINLNKDLLKFIEALKLSLFCLKYSWQKRKFTCLYPTFYNSARIETWTILKYFESKLNFLSVWFVYIQSVLILGGQIKVHIRTSINKKQLYDVSQ